MTKYYILLYIVLNLFLSNLVFAMKPTPFENRDYIYTDPTTQFQLISKLKDGTDRYSTEGTTQLLNSEGKVLWSMPSFVGRAGVRISPDGNVLILSGNSHFGGLFQPRRDEVMVEIFNQGVLLKNILFSDIFPDDPGKLIKTLRVNAYGGGWVETRQVIKDETVDWKTRTVNFTLYNNKVKKIAF